MERYLLVSVIIPVFNVLPYLNEALDSVINQTYRNLEIIIIDDGSTDGSGEICDEYKRDPRVQVIHQDNKGLSVARNVGMDMMTGDVVAFLDSDDVYDREYIATLLKTMEQYSSDIVMCKFTSHQALGRTHVSGAEVSRPDVEEGEYSRDNALLNLADGRINHSVWNKLYRRELWESIRFPVGHVYEDLETTFKVFDCCRSVFILNTPLYYHRKRPESITDTMTWNKRKDWLLANSHFLSYIELQSPHIFSLEKVEKYNVDHLRALISAYIRFNRLTNEEELKGQIVEYARKLRIMNLDIRTRMACWMICDCPWLLKIAYPLYLPIRKIVYRVFKR